MRDDKPGNETHDETVKKGGHLLSFYISSVLGIASFKETKYLCTQL